MSAPTSKPKRLGLTDWAIIGAALNVLFAVLVLLLVVMG